MLAWRIEEVSFTHNRYRSYTVSVIVHVILFAIIYSIASLSNSIFQAEMLPIEESKVMPVSIISYEEKNQKKFKKNSHVPSSAKNKASEDKHADTKFKSGELSVIPPEVEEVKQSTIKIERYEQLLAQHIANNIPEFPNDVDLPKRVDLWIKIDREGDIYDFGVLPEQSVIVEEYLKRGVLDSSPVPSPPQESFSSNFVQYLIPIIFK